MTAGLGVSQSEAVDVSDESLEQPVLAIRAFEGFRGFRV